MRRYRKKKVKKIPIFLCMITVGLLVAGSSFLIHSDDRATENNEIINIGKPFAKGTSVDEIRIDVPYISQEGDYPTGCEIVSTTMLLRYYGFSQTTDELILNLPSQKLKEKNGVLYGPHPSKAFVGSPYEAKLSFGCYAPVIKGVLNDVVDDKKEVVDLTGKTLPQLQEEYLKKGIPLLVWTTIEQLPTSEGRKWVIEETGETFTWLRNEHCVVLSGFTDTHYIVNDPYNSNGVVRYPKKLFETRFAEMGSQALALLDA